MISFQNYLEKLSSDSTLDLKSIEAALTAATKQLEREYSNAKKQKERFTDQLSIVEKELSTYPEKRAELKRLAQAQIERIMGELLPEGEKPKRKYTKRKPEQAPSVN